MINLALRLNNEVTILAVLSTLILYHVAYVEVKTKLLPSIFTAKLLLWGRAPITSNFLSLPKKKRSILQ